MKYRPPISCMLSAAIVCAPVTLRAEMVTTPTLLNQAEGSSEVALVKT